MCMVVQPLKGNGSKPPLEAQGQAVCNSNSALAGNGKDCRFARHGKKTVATAIGNGAKNGRLSSNARGATAP